MNAIHSSFVWTEINGSDIPFDDFKAGEPSICGPLSQDGAGVGVPLDGDDGGVSKNEVCE
jgi:hypothetical protein